MTTDRDHWILDIETDGLLNELTKIHCMVMRNVDTDEVHVFDTPKMIGPAAEWAASRQLLIGHHLIGFDAPAIEKVTGVVIPKDRCFDTLLAAPLVWPDVKEKDRANWKKNPEEFPGQLIGRHSLKAWGYRLRCFKGDYSGGWETYSDEMRDYCVQDTEVTLRLYNLIMSKKIPASAFSTEMNLAWPLAQMMRNGFPFDVAKAVALNAELSARRQELHQKLVERFGSWTVKLRDFVPKRNNSKLGYIAGVPVPRTKVVEFNPTSRDHIANRLITLYGWKPEEFTDGGKPKVDEDSLSHLSYPGISDLIEYLMVSKRLSQLSEGDGSLMRAVKADGRIYHRIYQNGTVSGRSSHSAPNISQVPKCSSAYGPQFRELFHRGSMAYFVGSDASGLELRCLGHFLAPYDGGAFAKSVVEGKSSEGTDVHTLNCIALGLEPKKLYTVGGAQVGGRDLAKTFIYALLYGAGIGKIARILGVSTAKAKKIMKQFNENLPALAKLRDAVAKAATRGYVVGLDGRVMPVRSPHSALNLILQSAGAVICKLWITEWEHILTKEHGLVHGWDGDFVLCVYSHDELGGAAKSFDIAHLMGDASLTSIQRVAERVGFRCPLATEYAIGDTWKDVH